MQQDKQGTITQCQISMSFLVKITKVQLHFKFSTIRVTSDLGFLFFISIFYVVLPKNSGKTQGGISALRESSA